MRAMASTARRMALALLVLTGLPAALHAGETRFCNFLVLSLPFTASSPGRYCFVANMSTAMAFGSAIEIAANDVTIDLNRFRLDGSLGGRGTRMIGIMGIGRKRVNVRNGTVSGFLHGIYFTAFGTKNVVVEDMRAEGNTASGITVFGDNMIVRNCTVTDTGGSTAEGAFAFGIDAEGNHLQVIDNSVTHTFAAGVGGFASGIQSESPDSTLFNNRIFGVSGGGGQFGILCGTGGGTALIRDNAVIGATTPYLGCVPVGTTNFP